ncbi:MAG TPA: NAD(P)-dependent oxidoreductase [Planctomycetota bacterium]|nr:NAD(P)-dependent oxidoreductase [Planctomycetota bacterium]
MKIGVFGLGIIGTAWADNLVADGHEVFRWNRTPKNNPGFTASAPDAAAKAEMLFIVVSDPAAVQSVLDQILPVLKSGQIVIQSSTISPEASRSFAAQVQKTGAAFLEAPFTGSKPAAEARKTVYFIGGDMDVLERARPVLAGLSSHIEHIGTVGSASALKLAMNVNIALVSEALCESLALARAAGISDEKYFAVLKLNSSHSKMADLKQGKLQTKDYTPQFSLKHMAKDLRLALGSVDALNLPQTRGLVKLYEQGLASGWGDDDFIALMRLIDDARHSHP